jgi:hypothetical protein
MNINTKLLLRIAREGRLRPSTMEALPRVANEKEIAAEIQRLRVADPQVDALVKREPLLRRLVGAS